MIAQMNAYLTQTQNMCGQTIVWLCNKASIDVFITLLIFRLFNCSMFVWRVCADDLHTRTIFIVCVHTFVLLYSISDQSNTMNKTITFIILLTGNATSKTKSTLRSTSQSTQFVPIQREIERRTKNKENEQAGNQIRWSQYVRYVQTKILSYFINK